MTHAPDDYALVIGINSYPRWLNGAKSLKGPVKDAQDFRNWLVDEEGGGLAPENVKLILSTEKPLGPRQWAVDDAFREIREQSQGKTRRRFYFYFSGHGHSRAGSWQQQSLCLANWSPVDAGAALHLESYIKASVGCLKFSESIFFLDCCRVRAVVPLGQQSELECGDPDSTDRYSAILFGSDQYGPTFEGEINEEIRGYFTAGLLNVLKQGTIELGELVERLRVIVPDLAKPRKQTARAVPADKKIYLGPPNRKPGLVAGARAATGTGVSISIISNLTGTNASEDPLPPQPGDISVLHDDLLVARGMGFVHTALPPGRYQIRIDHGDASASHDIIVGYEWLKCGFELPRRSSATLLSSTVDKREWLTDQVVAASKWDASGGGQAAFISLRPRQLGEAASLVGTLYLGKPSELRVVHEANSLHFLEPGTSELNYLDPDGGISALPIPIAKGWDTHLFIVINKGRPQLATASLSMRPAGAGFDPSDALIDAYERGIADLVTGGRGPDPATLDALLWGNYRNPLFGLLGAYFLVRKLRCDPEPSPADLQRLEIVARNLGVLLGSTAPDVVALRLLKQLISKERPTEQFPGRLPLFNIGFQAFIEATAWSDTEPTREFDQIALGLDANSPWTVWRSASKLLRVSLGLPPELWTYNLLSNVPDYVVGYMRDAISQSERTGKPLDLARLVYRTKLPLSVLLDAKAVAEYAIAFNWAPEYVFDFDSPEFRKAMMRQMFGFSLFDNGKSKSDKEEDDGEVPAET